MNTAIMKTKKESRDERAHRIAMSIIKDERIRRDAKTARLRAKRLALANT